MKLDYVYTTYENKKMGFLFEDMRLTEAHFFACDDHVGEICTAVVEKILPAIDGIFLVGPDRMKIFMHLEESKDRLIRLRKREKEGLAEKGAGRNPDRTLRVGDTVVLQITQARQKGKNYGASAELSLRGENLLIDRSGKVGISKKIKDKEKREALKQQVIELLREEDPTGEFGAVIRTAADYAEPEALDLELRKLVEELRSLIRRSETTPEYKILYSPEITVEEKLTRYSAGGGYSEICLHTDLPVDTSLIPGATDKAEGKEKEKEEGPGAMARTPVRIDRSGENSGSLLAIFNIPVLIDKALARKVFLPGGGYLYIEPTEAMTVIDVNSGKSIKGEQHEEKALRENLESAKEIFRLLRLRNISGIILIDFISMKKSESDQCLLAELRRLAAGDRCETHVVDMTKLGLVEMTRKKESAPLAESLGRDKRAGEKEEDDPEE